MNFMSTSKPKNMPAIPPKNIGGGKTMRMNAPAPVNPASFLSLDEPSETINVGDMDLDLDLEFASPDLDVPIVKGRGSVKGSPPPAPAKPHTTIEGIPPVKAAASVQKPPIKVRSGLLGHILVDNNLLTDEQRDFVLKLQAQSGNFFKIGQLAVKQGFLSEDDLERALAAQKKFVKKVHQEQARMIRLPEEVAKAASDSQESTAAVSGQGTAVYKWLGSALKHGASDLHVMSNKPLILRHLGKLIQSKQKPISEEAAATAFDAILTKDEKKTLEREQSVVKCIDINRWGRPRGYSFKHMNGKN
jgi:hypothetical protein